MSYIIGGGGRGSGGVIQVSRETWLTQRFGVWMPALFLTIFLFVLTFGAFGVILMGGEWSGPTVLIILGVYSYWRQYLSPTRLVERLPETDAAKGARRWFQISLIGGIVLTVLASLGYWPELLRWRWVPESGWYYCWRCDLGYYAPAMQPVTAGLFWFRLFCVFILPLIVYPIARIVVWAELLEIQWPSWREAAKPANADPDSIPMADGTRLKQARGSGRMMNPETPEQNPYTGLGMTVEENGS